MAKQKKLNKKTIRKKGIRSFWTNGNIIKSERNKTQGKEPTKVCILPLNLIAWKRYKFVEITILSHVIRCIRFNFFSFCFFVSVSTVETKEKKKTIESSVKWMRAYTPRVSSRFVFVSLSHSLTLSLHAFVCVRMNRVKKNREIALN